MPGTFTHLAEAINLLKHPEIAARETEQAAVKAAAAVRRIARAEAPRAKAGSRLPAGRKPGQLRSAIRTKKVGRGFDAQVSIKAGGLGPVIIGGNPAHEIDPKAGDSVAGLMKRHAHALALGPISSNGPVYAHVQHPAVAPVPYMEITEAKSLAEVERIMAEHGGRIVAEMAAKINTSGLL